MNTSEGFSRTRRLCLALQVTTCYLSLAFQAPAQTLIPFSVPAEFTTNLQEAGRYPGSNYVYSTLAGAGGLPGRVNVEDSAANDALALVPGHSQVISQWQTISVQFLFSKSSATGAVSGGVVQAGLLNAPTNVLTQRRTEYASMVGSVVLTSEGTLATLAQRTIFNGQTTESLSPVFSVPDGWLQLDSWHALTASGHFAFSLALWSLGPIGGDTPALLATLGGLAENPVLAGTSPVWFGLSAGSSGGVLALDNVFAVVPEPSAITFLIFGGGACFYLRRRGSANAQRR